MAQAAPGKHFRKGMTLFEIMLLFPDDETAERWFTEVRWPEGPHCPYCGSTNILSGAAHKTMPYRCREKDCRKRFSVRTKSAMEASNIGYRNWAAAFYLFATSLKGVSSMKLHRDLGITQKSAWFMAHRIREAARENRGMFAGPAEADETAFGGLEMNKHSAKKLRQGRGSVGKSIIAGIKDRETNTVRAEVVEGQTAETLQGFIHDTVEPGAAVYTDDAAGYRSLSGFDHESVAHKAGEYVRGPVHTNGIESFWAMLKRAHKGTFHKISKKHLPRYVREFSSRHNMRPLDTIDIMRRMVAGTIGKRLRYRDLIADNGLPSGARTG